VNDQERIDRETLLKRAARARAATVLYRGRRACTATPAASCRHTGPRCGYVEACQTGDCACFLDGNGQNPGACIDLLDGLCDTFQAIGTCPGGSDAECPSGARCFSSCCDDLGYPHLCGHCCPGTPGPPSVAPARRSAAVAWF
jgi:hypothetical protein